MDELTDDEIPRVFTLNEDEKIRVAILANSFLLNRRNDEEPLRKWEVIDDIRDILGPDHCELLREFVEHAMAHALSRIDGLVRIERAKARLAARDAKRLEKLLGKKTALLVKPDVVKKPRSQKKAERVEKLLGVENSESPPSVESLLKRWTK